MIPTLETVSTSELAGAGAMILPTIALCLWLKRPVGLWILHLLLIEYLCLYWVPMEFVRLFVGLAVVAVLVVVTEKRVKEAF